MKPTARRDLEALASQGKAQRVHGGVIAVEQTPPELPILQREGGRIKNRALDVPPQN